MTAIDWCVQALQNGQKILVCGNGGSAAMASHVAAELMGRFQGRLMQLPAIALSADVAVLTALANDYGYAAVFGYQVRTVGHAGDVLVALSTSGLSPNILAAIGTALHRGLRVIFLTGAGGHEVVPNLVTLPVSSTNTQRIQEIHLALLHALVQGIQEAV